MTNAIDPNVYVGMPFIKKVTNSKKTYWYYHQARDIAPFRLLDPDKWPRDKCIQDVGEKIAMSEMLLGENRPETSRLKLGDVLKSYMKNKKPVLAASSFKMYVCYCKRLLDYFGGKTPIRDINFETMQDFLNTINGSGYANSILQFVKSVWSDLKNSRLIKHNFIADIPKVPYVALPYEEWTEEEIKAYQDRWEVGTWERLAFEVLLQTGCRCSEALRLGPRNINGNVIFYTAGRARVRVKMKIGPELVQMLSHVVNDSSFFIGRPRSNHKSLSYAGFSYHFKNAAGKARVDKTVHGLRKSYAIRLAAHGKTELEAGNDINAVVGQ